MHDHEQTKVSVRLGATSGVELGESDREGRLGLNVDPFERSGGYLDPGDHRGSESNAHASCPKRPRPGPCRPDYGLPACCEWCGVNLEAKRLARKHGADGAGSGPGCKPAELRCGRPGLPLPAAGSTRLAPGACPSPGATASRSEHAGLKAPPLAAAVGGAR